MLRIIQVALLLTLSQAIILQGSGQSEQQDTNSEAADKHDPTSDLPIGLVETYSPSEVAPNARNSSEQRREERENKDLIAQQRMADATELMEGATQSMMWATWGSVGLLLVGTILLFWSLIQASAASRYAISVLKATEKANRAEYQPYIEVSDVSMAQTSQTIENIIRHAEHVCKFRFMVTNSGKTPAFILAKSIAARLNIATIIKHEVGVSGETVPFISTQRGLELPQLNAGDQHEVEISIPIRVDRQKFEGVTTTGPNILIDVGIRLSFADEFTAKGKRRVLFLVFEIVNNSISLKTFFSGMGGKSDDPDEWNKDEGQILPHAFYRNDILSEIK